MFKWFIRIAALCIVGVSIMISSLSAFYPEKLYSDQVAVLSYHHIDEKTQGPGTIPPQLLYDQLSYLKSQGYHFITFNDLRQFLSGGPVVDNAALVTFDDGYESFYTAALPVLRELDIPAVNFVITHDLGEPQSSALPSLTPDEIRTMTAGSSAYGVQCHTDALHQKINGRAALITRLTDVQGKQESDEQFRSRIVGDTKTCIDRLSTLTPAPVDAIAYPFGVYSAETKDLMRQAGIKYGFTVMPKMTTRDVDPLVIPRINAGGPYVTPELLHNQIMRRVAAVEFYQNSVPLRDTIEQIGGELSVDQGDHSIVIHYNGKEWRVQPNSAEVKYSGGVLQLDNPLRVIEGKTRIALVDLERIVGTKIEYSDSKRTFKAPSPDHSEIDQETKKDPATPKP